MNKSVSTQLKDLVKKQLETNSLTSKSPLIAVSGGPDSMCLLYILHQLNISGTVVHINYEMRGEDSDKDQELTEGFSSMWGYECISVKPGKPMEGVNFQKWARDVRYQIFTDLVKELQLDYIALAHHQDDQVETILQKLLRGSSPEYWTGMKVWDGIRFRPLLTASQSEIMDLCDREAIPYRIDTSNLEPKYARNFIRHDLSQRMGDFFPGWKENVLKLQETGQITRSAVDYIMNSVIRNNGLIIQSLREMEEDLRAAVIFHYLKKFGEGSPSRSFVHDTDELLNLQSGRKLQMNTNEYVIRDRDLLKLISKESGDELNVIIDKKTVKKGFDYPGFHMELGDYQPEVGSLFIETAAVTFPLTLRSRKSGDVFRPFGMDQWQKVSDHLTNRKVPSAEKENTLILTGADGTIIAILFSALADNGEHGSISETVRCSDQTKECIILRFND